MTKRRFRKDDVQFHSDGYREGHPAYNIKVHLWPDDVVKRYRGSSDHEYGQDEAFWAWFDEYVERETGSGDYWPRAFSDAWDWACESVYEQCKEDLMELFGVRERDIWCEGRSGGWMVVDYKVDHDMWGRHKIDSWDAIDVSKYARGLRIVETYKQDVGYQWLNLIAINFYESEIWERAEAEKRTIAHLREVDILGALV